MSKITDEYREIRRKEAIKHHMDMMKLDHASNRCIRKLDSSVNRLKDHNQKNPKDMVLIPNARLHKITV